MAFNRVIVLSSAIFILGILFSSCMENDRGKTTGIYPEYKINAVEGSDNLSILARFKEGNEFGEAVSLEPPSSITLDGESLLPDTARYGGVYYELFKPIDSFEGNHTLEYINAEGKSFKEAFSFKTVQLISTLPDSVSRGDLELELTGLNPIEIVRILMIDTSFLSEGINIADTVKNGKLHISAGKLNSLANGLVQLQLIRELEQPLTSAAGTNGKLIINYTLRREFFLKDN